ncbi:hypothetical protein [Streptomyces sp. NPDC048489]|uniref:hypothetical protein n=1 Tax=Streptomyces sp. NPDC048489 TaxID=3154504 RepID=UPI003443E7E2
MPHNQETADLPVSCTNCDVALDAVPKGLPCPTCGESTRRYHQSLHTNAATTGKVGRGIDRSPDRSWRELWHTVLRGLRDLESAYAGELSPPAEWSDLPAKFCLDCFQLKDWIKHDAARVPSSARGRVADQYARKSEAIALTGDVANTYKHHTRKPGETTAHVSHVQLEGDTVTFTIRWSKDDGTTGTRDGLELAREAVEDWRNFLAAHQMDKPDA